MAGLLAELANWPKFSPPAQSFRLVPAEAFTSFLALEGDGAGMGGAADGLGRRALEGGAAGLLAGWALHSRMPAYELQSKSRMPTARVMRRDLSGAPRVK
jgi:hypothetical protein